MKTLQKRFKTQLSELMGFSSRLEARYLMRTLFEEDKRQKAGPSRVLTWLFIRKNRPHQLKQLRTRKRAKRRSKAVQQRIHERFTDVTS